MDVVRQTACMVVNPIMANNFVSLFICTTVGRSSDQMTAQWVGPQTKGRLPPQSISDDLRQTISVAGLIVARLVLFLCVGLRSQS